MRHTCRTCAAAASSFPRRASTSSARKCSCCSRSWTIPIASPCRARSSGSRPRGCRAIARRASACSSRRTKPAPPRAPPSRRSSARRSRRRAPRTPCDARAGRRAASACALPPGVFADSLPRLPRRHAPRFTSMFVDSHCHLDFPEFRAELPELLAGMAAARVTHALCISVNLPDWPGVHSLATAHGNIYATAGVHPDYEDTIEPTVDKLVALAGEPKVVAIGETGLDYYRLEGDLEWQRRRFRTH